MDVSSSTAFVLLTSIFLAATADREHVDHGPGVEDHFKSGVHNVEFDHEAILGSINANHEFEQLPPAEAQRRLRLILDRMDSDGDGNLSKEEITKWVLKSFESLNEEETVGKLKDIDEDKDGHVSWPEYLSSTFSYTPEQVKQFAQENTPEVKTMIEMIEDDEAKFHLADQNKDGYLDLKEFCAFLHPYNYPYMHQYEIDRTLKLHDKNGDGFIDFKEYLGEAQPSKEQMIVEREQFGYYDNNEDGRLSGMEIKVWVLPEDQGIAEEEAEHLTLESDANGDGILTKEEILDKYDLWVGSAATNYGQNLHEEL